MDEAEAAVRILALVVKLHRDGQQPWPPRARVSEITGISLPMIDVAITNLQATKQITVWTATTSGNMREHDPTITTQRFIQPSQESLDLIAS